MSSWCPDAVRPYLVNERMVCIAMLALASTVTQAADVHFQPEFEARVETNTNRNLATEEAEERDTTGYNAEVGGIVTFASPRHETSVRPRVRVQEYDDTSQLEKVEGFLDLRSRYLWERSELDIEGAYSHQDLYNAELARASFDDLNPDDPSSPGSGDLEPGQTRDRLYIGPRFSHEFTERSGAVIGARYESAWYGDGNADVTDYDYVVGRVAYSFKYSPSMRFDVGPYASVYDADNGAKYNAYGASANLYKVWSERTQAQLRFGYEQNDIETPDPLDDEDSVSAFHAELTVLRVGEVSRMRFVGGRSISPNADGRKVTTDGVRLQYDRDLSQRLSFRVAGRYFIEDSVDDALSTGDRDYARGDLGFRYRFAQEWYVAAGYRYIWQEQEAIGADADNHSFLVGIGYSGLRHQSQIRTERDEEL
jgi:hypothetical protein